MNRPPVVHASAHGLSGSLLEVSGTRRVRLGEWVEVRTGDGRLRRGRVLDAGSRSLVQILDDPVGLAPGRAEVRFTGRLPRVRVGRELLGRVLDGLGRPRDGLPEPVGEAVRPLAGRPINPVRRVPPSRFVETGLSAIDGLNTLVRGQKLPIFAGPGLPALDLAARVVEGARVPERGEEDGGEEGAPEEPFAVVFVALGIGHRESAMFRRRFAEAGALERTVLYLNETLDPTAERLTAPRAALAQAEHLAFDHGLHVLVVMVDVTDYGEALRESASARDEIPGRRGYPGELYSDLASLFERAGILRDRPGSLTQLPVLTLPDDDLTHPIPDLTGYITEGQVVLSRPLHRRGVFPPVDVLPSLSRLMNRGIGEGRTDPDHRAWADQLYAAYSAGVEAREMAGIVGEEGLTPADRRALGFARRFEDELVDQGEERRTLHQTLDVGWRLLATLPREDLHRLDEDVWRRRVEERESSEEEEEGGPR